MTFFESLLVLLLAAVVLLQVARRLSLPYPAMLAIAGVALALIPGAPYIAFEPATALALFMAPVILDAAYDFPVGALRRIRRQLIVFAVLAVLITAALVAFAAWKLMGLPLAAAIALGAIVAPPDAAAATAVLRAVSIPRDADTILKGESLFNDATALLLFSGSLAVLSSGALTPAVGLRLALAVPGGLLFGWLCGVLLRALNPFVSNTLGGNIFQFVMAYLVWISAEHLRLSAVLTIIAFAMTIAQSRRITSGTRMRVQSFAVWSAVVFALNVFAFLLMGLQGRRIVSRMNPAHLRDSLLFAGTVVLIVVVARLVIVLGFDRLSAWWERLHQRRSNPDSWRRAVLEGWTGMRGFVTLATAIALPASFPHRDLAVLTAFFVVLATLVVQGLTLVPLVRLLKLDQGDAQQHELATGRSRLARAALQSLEDKTGAEADLLRSEYLIQRDALKNAAGLQTNKKLRKIGLSAIAAQRQELEKMRSEDAIGSDTYLLLQEELDWNELTLLSDDERRIEES
ncbi:MAG TPA: cation:proton antiporter [Bryobacteraceae bacterium]|nr:cation:proton antiporter [Bryobacteraceae bacterium]